MTPADAQKLLDANFAPWVRALAPQIVAIDETAAVIDIPITTDIVRVGGIVSGQALATLADTTMVFACVGQAGVMVPVSTITLDTQFLRPATGDRIRATGEITRAGRSMIFAQCTLTAEPMGKSVALATATFAKPAK